MTRYADTLTRRENFRFFYSVKPFETRTDGGVNKCKHTDSSIPERTGPEQMEEIFRISNLEGGSLDRTTLFGNSWPATNTTLVNNLVDAIKKSVETTSGQNVCYARSAQLMSGVSNPVTLWNTTQISDVLNLQQATNQIEVQDIVQKYGINLSNGGNVTLNIDRCCVEDLSQAQWGVCNSQFTQKIEVAVQRSN